MYVDIIPIRRLPRAFDAFTYQIPEYAEVDAASLAGRWVRIPFQKRIEIGIVWAIRESPPPGVEKVLSIESFVDAPPLTELQRGIAEYMAERYFVSLPLVLFAILPEVPKRMIADSGAPSSNTLSISISKSRQKEIVSMVRESLQSESRFQFVPLAALEEVIAFATGVIKTGTPGSHLVVVPTVAAAEALGTVLSLTLKAHRVRVLHSDLAKTVFWKRWQPAEAATHEVLVATKLGMFAPTAPLQSVLFVHESDPAHRQSDQNPRYDARDIAEELAMRHNARLLFCDAVPSLRIYSNRAVSRIQSTGAAQQRQVADLKQERTLKRFGPLAESVEERMQNTPGRILLFLNQRGTRRNLHCTDCGWQHLCPECKIPLVQHAKGVSRCHSCGSEYAIPLTCPVCQNAKLRLHGYGTAKLEEYIKSQFPAKSVFRYDSDQTQAFERQADILIATERILQLDVLPRCELTVFVNIDSQLNRPDYKSTEQTFAMLERVAAATSSPLCILQSYQAEHPLAKAFQQKRPDLVFDEELRFRKALQLPPFTTLITLRTRNTDKAKLDADIADALKQLQDIVDKTPGLAVEGPVVPVPALERGQHQAVLRVKVLNSQPDFATMRATLMHLPPHWIFDIEYATISDAR